MIKLACLLLPMLAISCSASAQPVSPLNLNCNIIFQEESLGKGHIFGEEATLSNQKIHPDGRTLIHENSDYEFWALAHSVQTLGDDRYINNFEVAIKNKNSGAFAHGLSDSVFVPTAQISGARVRLVEYHEDSFLEAESILFECLVI